MDQNLVCILNSKYHLNPLNSFGEGTQTHHYALVLYIFCKEHTKKLALIVMNDVKLSQQYSCKNNTVMLLCIHHSLYLPSF